MPTSVILNTPFGEEVALEAIKDGIRATAEEDSKITKVRTARKRRVLFKQHR